MRLRLQAPWGHRGLPEEWREVMAWHVAPEVFTGCAYTCAGALVGPPWAKRENGFVFTETADGGVSLYYEPHCDYDVQSLQGVESVDIVITPGVNQELLSFPLVSPGF